MVPIPSAKSDEFGLSTAKSIEHWWRKSSPPVQGGIMQKFPCHIVNNFCTPPLFMCVREGSENHFRSSHPTIALALSFSGHSAYLYWQQSDICFTERSCALHGALDLPAIIWCIEPVLDLWCWEWSLPRDKHRSFVGPQLGGQENVNVSLQMWIFLIRMWFWNIYLSNNSSCNQDMKFSMLIIKQPWQP